MTVGCCEDEGCPVVSTNKLLANDALKSIYPSCTIILLMQLSRYWGKVEAANGWCGCSQCRSYKCDQISEHTPQPNNCLHHLEQRQATTHLPVGPSTHLSFLGIIINTINMLASISEKCKQNLLS